MVFPHLPYQVVGRRFTHAVETYKDQVPRSFIDLEPLRSYRFRKQKLLSFLQQISHIFKGIVRWAGLYRGWKGTPSLHIPASQFQRLLCQTSMLIISRKCDECLCCHKRNDGITESSKTVHPMGSPMSHSTNRGLSFLPLL